MIVIKTKDTKSGYQNSDFSGQNVIHDKYLIRYPIYVRMVALLTWLILVGIPFAGITWYVFFFIYTDRFETGFYLYPLWLIWLGVVSYKCYYKLQKIWIEIKHNNISIRKGIFLPMSGATTFDLCKVCLNSANIIPDTANDWKLVTLNNCDTAESLDLFKSKDSDEISETRNLLQKIIDSFSSHEEQIENAVNLTYLRCKLSSVNALFSYFEAVVPLDSSKENVTSSVLQGIKLKINRDHEFLDEVYKKSEALKKDPQFAILVTDIITKANNSVKNYNSNKDKIDFENFECIKKFVLSTNEKSLNQPEQSEQNDKKDFDIAAFIKDKFDVLTQYQKSINSNIPIANWNLPPDVFYQTRDDECNNNIKFIFYQKFNKKDKKLLALVYAMIVIIFLAFGLIVPISELVPIFIAMGLGSIILSFLLVLFLKMNLWIDIRPDHLEIRKGIFSPSKNFITIPRDPQRVKVDTDILKGKGTLYVCNCQYKEKIELYQADKMDDAKHFQAVFLALLEPDAK